jgi:hypothetical protein
LFINSALSLAGASRADDADIIAPVGVNDNEQIAAKCSADRDVTAFCYRVIGVRNCEREGIAKNSRRFFKADPVF